MPPIVVYPRDPQQQPTNEHPTTTDIDKKLSSMKQELFDEIRSSFKNAKQETANVIANIQSQYRSNEMDNDSEAEDEDDREDESVEVYENLLNQIAVDRKEKNKAKQRRKRNKEKKEMDAAEDSEEDMPPSKRVKHSQLSLEDLRKLRDENPEIFAFFWSENNEARGDSVQQKEDRNHNKRAKQTQDTR